MFSNMNRDDRWYNVSDFDVFRQSFKTSYEESNKMNQCVNLLWIHTRPNNLLYVSLLYTGFLKSTPFHICLLLFQLSTSIVQAVKYVKI